ncbi:MAG: hypothetical protein JNL10_03830 [Verrucomicrobiales bacterium]|nr:hypothetical protein [Verrucomicrobiales bacterium]
MARIVGVHGVGQSGNPPPGIVQEWWDAIALGQSSPGRRAAVTSEDVTVAYYAPLYRRKGLKGVESDLDVRELTAPWEQEFVLALAAEAERSAGHGGTATKFVPVGKNLQRALDLLLTVPGMGKITESTLIAWFVKEVYRYLHEPAIREGARTVVSDAIAAGDTRVVIAHSLGSVVAYEALSRGSRDVDTLVTVGSPLGLQKLIFDQLDPSPKNGRLPWPGTVRRWINLAQRRDVVAMTKRLAPLVHPGPGGAMVEDVLVPDPPGLFSAHNAVHYLAQPELASALAEVFPPVD